MGTKGYRYAFYVCGILGWFNVLLALASFSDIRPYSSNEGLNRQIQAAWFSLGLITSVFSLISGLLA